MTIMPDAPVIRIPAQRPQSCQPWCVQHIADPLGPGTCLAAAQTSMSGESVDLTYQPDEGARINLWRPSFSLLTIDDAERHARAVLAQVAVARATSTGAVTV